MRNFSFKKKILLLLLSALFLFITGCSDESSKIKQPPMGELTEYKNKNETPQSGGSLRLALVGSKTLNPILTKSQNNLYVFKLIYDGLFKIAPNDVIEPVLCDSYTISPDGLTYEFVIKRGVSFHNGAPLTAVDAEATLSLLLASDGFYQNRFADIASYHSEGMSLFVTLKRPVVNFAALFDFPILSKEDISRDVSAYIPNGTGRYKVQSYKKSKELYLTVNENYHQSFSPYISDIVVNLLKDHATAISMLENYQIDLLPSGVVDLYSYTPKRNLSTAEFSSGRFTFLGINNQHPALLSARTRTALATSINKATVLSNASIQYASLSDLPLPTGSFWYNHQLPEVAFNQENARRLLADDGWQDTDGDGILDKDVYGEKVNLSIRILVNEENQIRLKIGELISQYFNGVGVQATVHAVSFAEYEKKINNRDYDVFIGSVSLTSNYDLSFMLKTDENFYGISIEGIDQTFNALTLLEFGGQQQSLFYELCETIKTEMPVVGLYFEDEVLFFDEGLKGAITPSASDIFYGIENWFLSKN